jgi:hypothetical protein
MKKTLYDYLDIEKCGLGPEDATILDEVMGVFNSSCELMAQEEEWSVNLDTAGAQAWIDSQEMLWTNVQEKYQHSMQFNACPGIE